ncbi:MAG TPA: MarR family transcriptional regulator [Candidatus Saccharimonadia bacterium]|nr:MarR family transcriptional regulator [Candidatus Saccharimonadia bacterium]
MKNSDHRAQLIQSIFESMSTMKRGIAGRWQPSNKDCPVSHGQLELLFTIYHGQPVNFKQLARQLYLTPGAVSQLVEGLEQHKLITRQADPKDRRIQCLEVSAEGIKLIKQIENYRRSIMEDVMTSLTDEELELWLRIHKKFLEQFEKRQTDQHKKETL